MIHILGFPHDRPFAADARGSFENRGFGKAKDAASANRQPGSHRTRKRHNPRNTGNGNGNERSYTFLASRKAPKCRFSVLHVFHGNTANPDIDWHVIGYASFDDYLEDKRIGFQARKASALSWVLVTQ
ncbi:MAG TPA: hypothetical protein VKS80_15165 [Trinickia sp.]|nr:hypothetical protein [Trinickia sp.]